MTVNINKPQINLREKLKKLERPTTDKLAVKGYDGVLLDPLTGDLNLQGIDSVVEGAAVDVFVYDTRKDSDGGAWRKRTHHTSWYDIPNYDDEYIARGSRKDFPAVAILVVDSSGLGIYDGDDPDLPLWMKFKTNNRGAIYATPSQGCVAAMNGIICIGVNTGDNGSFFSEFGFIHDKMRLHQGSAINQTRNTWISGMVQKSDGSSWLSGQSSISISSGQQLRDRKTNDVAVTVLPNAPIDDTTGLPRLTIAIATDSGTSVVKDDGAVVDFNDALGSSRPVSTVVIRGNDIVHWNINNGTLQQFFDALSATLDSTNDAKYNYTSGGGHATCENVSALLRNSNDGPYHIVTRDSKSIAAGAQSGMSIFVDGADRTITTNNHSIFDSSVAYVTSDYNTGWMYGDIRGAFLSDTNTANISNATNNVVTNPNFASDSDWTKESGWSITGGVARWTQSGGQNGRLSQTITLTPGDNYVATVNVKDVASNGDVWLEVRDTNTSGTVRLQKNIGAGAATGVYAFNFTAVTSTSVVILHSYSQDTFDADDLYVYPAEEDRSLNNNGLQVFGTISRTPVESGADLVGYGGFNNNNYIRQPYNSDLKFEQNDFSIMFWIYDTGVNEHTTIISKDEREFDISRLGAAFGNKLRIYTRNSSEDLRAPDSASALPFNKWTHVCVVYTRGSTKKVYINGELDSIITGTNGQYDIDNTSYGLNIGVRNTGGTINYAASGIKLALLRISGGAPSGERIKKIYDDEKVLFQENAKATLYGSSDAITALAYDDTTSLLHVGTSSGRSTFSGLKRVENTKTAVTTAISASNGLVVER
jgi:hypothetical protein